MAKLENTMLLAELSRLLLEKPKQEWELMSFYSQVKIIVDTHKQQNFRVNTEGKCVSTDILPQDRIRMEVDPDGKTNLIIQSKMNYES